MRPIDADALCEEFKARQRAALRWKERAIYDDDLEREIRADAILAFLSEVKLTIDKARTIEIGGEQEKSLAEDIAEVVNKIGEGILEVISRIDWDEVLKYLEASKEEQPSQPTEVWPGTANIITLLREVLTLKDLVLILKGSGNWQKRPARRCYITDHT